MSTCRGSDRLLRLARPLRTAGLAIAASMLVACAGFVPQVGPGPEPQPPPSGYVTLTTPIIALGDTQEHLATGYPLRDNDSAIDAWVEVTQRPPEQPLFGRRVMEHVLQRHPGEPFIHLGDVLDLSCRVEATRMNRVFAAAPNVGAILPGNHDGLMFGIFSYSVVEDGTDTDAQRWNKACRRGALPEDRTHKTGSEAFSKRDFISAYLELQSTALRPEPTLRPPPPRGEQVLSWRSPHPDAFLTAIEARLLDGVAYADSYLAQRLRLPRAPGATRDVIVIALDTNQAGPLASTWDTLLGRSPGSVGHVNLDQVTAIEGWVDEAILQGDLVVFAGHHNWQALGLPSRSLLRAQMARLRHPLVYLSAHTHSGFWALHRAVARQPLLELNVSSLSDWPIAYRRVSFAYDEAAQRLLVRGELMPSAGKPTLNYADLLQAWELETCARSGMDTAEIRQHDAVLVNKQRQSRGSLAQWLLVALGPACETCEQPLFEHGQAYQDAMLEALLQAAPRVKPLLPRLPPLVLPAACGGQPFEACATRFMAERPADYAGQVDLFRRKTQLVAAVNDWLDRIDEPLAKAYMTCRAVQAAKIDFDATDDERNENRGEAKRRAEQFFRIEASVGME